MLNYFFKKSLLFINPNYSLKTYSAGVPFFSSSLATFITSFNLLKGKSLSRISTIFFSFGYFLGFLPNSTGSKLYNLLASETCNRNLLYIIAFENLN